jgi:biotin transport system substrate-specific component
MSLATAPTRRRVLADALVGPRRLATDLALVVGGTAVVALLAQVSIPLWPVPITGQTLGVVIVGAALGAWRGAASLTLYLVAGLAGLPVFADFTGGLATVMKPSFGFIIGFIAAAFVMGWLAERNWDRRFGKALVGFVLASAIPFVFGVPYLALVLGQLGLDNSPAAVLSAGVTPFILGGFVKALIAAAVVPLAWKGVRALDRRDRD